MSDKMTAVAEAIKHGRCNDECDEFFCGDDEFWSAVSGLDGTELAQVLLECPEAFSRYDVKEHHIDFSKISAQDWIMVLARHPRIAKDLEHVTETSMWKRDTRIADEEFAKDAKWVYNVHAGRAYICGTRGRVRTESDKSYPLGPWEKEWYWGADALSRLTVIKVPAKVDGIPVFSFGCDMFEGCHSMEKLIVAEGVVEVGGFTFYNGGRPHEIVLPSTLRYIRPYAFTNCGCLREQVIPEGCVSIGSHAFEGCWRLQRIRIPKTVKRIGDRAFVNCAQLEEIILESEDCEFGEGILQGCTALRRITGLLGPRLEALNVKWRFAQGNSCEELKESVTTFVSQAKPDDSDETDAKIFQWFKDQVENILRFTDGEEEKVKEFQSWITDEFRKHGFVV